MSAKVIFSFLLGAAGGSACTWYLVKETYAKQSEQDILSTKEAFRGREEKLKAEIKALKEQLGLDAEPNAAEPTVLANGKVQDKEDVVELARGRKYTQYTASVISQGADSTDTLRSKYAQESPYVITPYEFGELDYTKITLMYYADDVLADENGVVVDDVDEIVGDALDHFNEIEDDAVYCRSDMKRCDYEILKDLRRYKDVRKTYPPNL